MAYLAGSFATAFGRQPGRDALDWQATAALGALDDSGDRTRAVDALLVGYATTSSHLMPGDRLAELLGLRPDITFGVTAGGASGLSMVHTAANLVDSGQARSVLVVAGEDRASGQGTDTSVATLAQVGHREYEVPLGATVPAYYALLASAYLHRRRLPPQALAPLAVAMRAHAVDHPGAHHRTPITTADVLASRPVADPLRLLDCCPVSDGGAAFLVTAEPTDRAVHIAGAGQAHRHQHLTEADFEDFGARRAAGTALAAAGYDLADMQIAGIYDSFTITLALLLEEIGFSRRGQAGADAAAGCFARDGALPLNTHGGLLSYGHCGVAGGLAHLAEVVAQLRGEAGSRQCADRPRRGFVHADGGVMSAHVSLVLDREAP